MLRLLAGVFLVATSCKNVEVEEQLFEDRWWELESYPICFNMSNNNGQLLTYEDRIYENGEWIFYEPDTYVVGSRTFYITYLGNSCWDIDESGIGLSQKACECTLIPWVE